MISNTYNLYIDGSIKLLSDKEGNYYNPQVVLLINFEMIVNILFFAIYDYSHVLSFF